jgi:CBS domain-containing protein
MTTARRIATVADVMAIAPVTVRASASLTDAARLMDQHHISGLPVVDASGSLVGVLSQTDLARVRATEYLWSNWHGLAVRHLMSHPAETVHPTVPLALAVQKMERLRIHRLIVVDDRDEGLPIGVLSLTDVVHAITLDTAGDEPVDKAVLDA